MRHPSFVFRYEDFGGQRGNENNFINLYKNMVQTSKFQLSGLTCGACEKVISKRLQAIGGVKEVHVSAENGAASIIASRPISTDEVTEALQGTHYAVINNS